MQSRIFTRTAMEDCAVAVLCSRATHATFCRHRGGRGVIPSSSTRTRIAPRKSRSPRCPPHSRPKHASLLVVPRVASKPTSELDRHASNPEWRSDAEPLAKSSLYCTQACHPAVGAARKCFPEAFSRLEGDGSPGFPFSDSDIETTLERWTADWLEWEQEHESNYQRKVAAIDAALEGGVPESKAVVLRTELQVVEQEKLDSYQRRYSEYVGISRALQQLTQSAASDGS